MISALFLFRFNLGSIVPLLIRKVCIFVILLKCVIRARKKYNEGLKNGREKWKIEYPLQHGV